MEQAVEQINCGGLVVDGGINGAGIAQGNHIAVRQLFDQPYAYIFQHPDGRIVFALPYERAFTLIGTTDLEFAGDLDDAPVAPADSPIRLKK